MPIETYTGPFGRAELKHLLGRTLFGRTNADLAHFEGMGMNEVVDALLDFDSNTTPPVKTYWQLNNGTPDPSLVDPTVAFGDTWIDTPRDPDEPVDPSLFRIVSFVSWKTGQMVDQQRNLREKLVLCLFNHMPVEAFEVFLPRAVYDHDQLLRQYCTGNFRELVREMTINTAMLVYLNGTFNNVLQPDENYARELMELFTLGEGSGYTEADVQAAARVLTGWIVREQDNGVPIVVESLFLPFLHDTGDKQFSAFFDDTVIQGQAGPNAGINELNALLDMIFAKEEASLHICRRIYRFFVKGEIDAVTEAEVITPLAELFRDTVDAPDQLRQVFTALFTSAHFFSADVRGCRIKSPADLVFGALRELGMPYPTEAQVEAQYLTWRDTFLLVDFAGQNLLNPTNVAGWPAYHQFPQYDGLWVDTATFPARNSALLAIVFVGLATDMEVYQAESQDLSFQLDLLAVVAQFSDPGDPNVLVAEAADLLFAVPVSQEVLDQLKTGYLLFGQQFDHYWSDAYGIYMDDPDTTDPAAQLVPALLQALFYDMLQAAENHLH